jgi:hypothetical protein
MGPTHSFQNRAHIWNGKKKARKGKQRGKNRKTDDGPSVQLQ